MKKIFILFLVFASGVSFAQEGVEPLRFNSKIKKELTQQKASVLHESYTYLFDTLSLPFFDDFSRDHFKDFTIQIGNPNVLDSTWFHLGIAGTPTSWGSSYMTDTSYRYEIDTVSGYGFDSLKIDTIALPSSFVDVYNLDNYPVTFTNTEVWPSFYLVDSLWTTAVPDVTTIEVNPDLVQDSLTMYFVVELAADTNVFWQDRYAYRNDNFPLTPQSIGVATFDGIDDIGYPYDWSSSSAVGKADYLTSKPINLGGTVDSVYFSFLYQAGGLGEAPDTFDSLTLEFWSPVNSDWTSVWRTTGNTASSSTFTPVLIAINSPLYKQPGFQFRFTSYGSLTGSLDHWHIDYVKLDDFRSFDDVVLKDWAFQFPAPSLINEFTSMPWTHFMLDPHGRMRASQTVKTYNSDDIDKFVVGADCHMDLFFEGTQINTIPYVNPGNVLALSSRDMDYTILASFWYDTAYADTFATFNVRYLLNTTTNPRYFENDTLWQTQEFENYYSYDDGSAEEAYGLVGNGAELAYKFTMPNGVTDSLRAVKMHFEATVNDASDELFFIQVWNDIGGEPGDLIYTTDDQDLPTSYVPKYKYGVDGYYEYVLPESVNLTGTFYVGWKQSSANRLNIGFDKNINNQDKIFYDLGSGWSTTGFEGSLMIRPVFVSDYDDVLISVKENAKAFDFEMYPNPASDVLTVNVKSDFSGEVKIFDLQGKLIQSEAIFGSSQLTISEVPVGMYIVQLISEDGSYATSKLSVSR